MFEIIELKRPTIRAPRVLSAHAHLQGLIATTRIERRAIQSRLAVLERYERILSEWIDELAAAPRSPLDSEEK